MFIGEPEDHFYNFFKSNKNIKIIKKEKDMIYAEGVLIFFLKDLKKTFVGEEIKKINLLKSKNYIFLPRDLKDININPIHKVILYPMEIEKFELILQADLHEELVFGDIFLRGNYLTNKENNLKVYFTETQTSIFKLLLVEKIVKKEKLKKDILNFSSILETKSLESHLSRLRKKLTKIYSSTKIVSFENDYVKLIEGGINH